MTQDDPYKVLGVKRGASAREIKRAYHKAARASHPDLHPGDAAAEERFKEIQAAYALLSDPERLREWEQGRLSFREVMERIDPDTLRLDSVLSQLLFGAGHKDAEQGEGQKLAVAIPASVAERGGVVAITVAGRKVRFRVPAGSSDGTRLRLSDGTLITLRLR